MDIKSPASHGNTYRGVLLKTQTSKEQLLAEFLAGSTLVELARKYERSGARIWQILRDGCTEEQFEQFRLEHSTNRKTNRLERFITFSRELGRIPGLKEVKDTLPGIQTNYREFKRIAEEQGYIYTTDHFKRGRKRKFADQKLLEYLKKLAARLGRTPSCNDINNDGKFTHNMYVTSFGSVQKAQEMAGLAPNKKYNSIDNARRTKRYVSEEHCLEDLKRVREKLGKFPSIKQLRTHGKYPFSKYYSRLGGIKEIKSRPDFLG